MVINVINGEAHRNRCLEGPWDRTRDHDGERAEAFADASRQGDTRLNQVDAPGRAHRVAPDLDRRRHAATLPIRTGG